MRHASDLMAMADDERKRRREEGKPMRGNDYRGAVPIPAAKSGEYSIEHVTHKAGHVFGTANLRCMLFGQKSENVKYDVPTRWHSLVGPTGTWMTDLPIEQAQHDAALRNVRDGHVLVGGLGLGYAAQLLARRRGIKSVTVVEIAADVIKLVERALRQHLGKRDAGKVRVVHADLHEYLRGEPERFDHAFYDIWQADSEGTFHDVVVPLHQASVLAVGSEPICWNEDIMRGQLHSGLLSRVLFTNPSAAEHGLDRAMQGITREAMATPEGNVWWDWAVEFFKRLPSGVEVRPEDADRMVRAYVTLYGRRNWLERWKATRV